MSIVSYNTNSSPMPLAGASIQVGNYSNSPYLSQYYNNGYSIHATPFHLVDSITSVNQVVGLVPLFPCESLECREGKYGSSSYDFMLPVFSESQLGTWGDYKNDYNTWLFNVPSGSALASCSFFLDKKNGTSWVEQAELIDDTYGFYYSIGELCNKNYYTGFKLLWNKVLHELGEGVYRFRMGRTTGTFKESINHIKITFIKPGVTATIELNSVGYGAICPAFTCNSALTYAQNMQNLVIWINNYQNTISADPSFRAEWDGTEIDLFGTLGQNCSCSATVLNVTYIDYAQAFIDGENSYQVVACYATPPFCLNTWDCYAVDGTTRWEAFYSGGVIGNADKTKVGQTWSFCCSGRPVVYPELKAVFTMQFYQQGIIYENTTFTFTPDLGYTLCNPVTFVAGTTPTQCATQLALAINTYQAGLGTPQFSAVVPPYATRRVDITNLFGQNIGMLIQYTDKDPIPSGNTIQLVLNSLIAYLPITPTGGSTFIWNIQTQFNGGTNVSAQTNADATPILWQDAIRVGGEFGYETTEYERTSIKYQTGVINKIRDEALLKFKWKSSSLPWWFHERFKTYGLMADKTLVSDYNLNNADYSLKQYSVQLDSGYSPEFKGYTRNTLVNCEFKSATENLKRSRCC